ncbi:MAG TPA: response regulator [Kofleriaceae bacterium]
MTPQREKLILVVDDDADMLEVFLQVLETAGYATTGASHGQQALDRLEGGLRPSLILLDLMMPVMTGWELDEKLAADPALSSIPVVFISAGGAPSPTTRTTRYLKKPVPLNILLETVRTHCA